ncbi:Ribokinase [Collimonas arenae]|uniref:Ribokinase n=1 Tax=Collimonas arenae TaxID=279058 RepID=A0A0A1FF43_9BURK|nr:hypothetical protein [Collimonas arenae]AIY43373.1 Ribokinase [Collimonas arenae]
MIVPPSIAPFAAAAFDASANGFSAVFPATTATRPVDREPIWLKPVDKDDNPVDNDVTLLLVLLKPVDNEEIPLTAVLKPVDVDVDSDVTLLPIVLRPVDVDVDSDATLLLVLLKPVDSEAIPVDAEVDSDVTLLFVVLKPVDKEVIPLVAVLRPLEVDVDRDDS